MKRALQVAKFIIWCWRLCKAWLPQALGTAATILGIVWAAYQTSIWTSGLWAFCLAVVLAVLSLFAQGALQRPSYMELARRSDNAVAESAAKSRAIEQTFTVLLRRLAEDCGVASNADRASVYYFRAGQFIMLARWSIHPTYTLPGRKQYPTGEGAIGDAWDRGSVVTILPATRKVWEKRLVAKHGFQDGETATLKMQCQSIAGLRIESGQRAVGVLVFESTDPKRVSQATIDKAKASKVFDSLSELVGAVAELTPRIEELVHAQEQNTKGTPWKPVPAKGPAAIA